MSSKTTSLQHWTSFDQIPVFTHIEGRWPEALADNKEPPQMLMLQTQPGQLLMLSTPEVFFSMEWYQFRDVYIQQEFLITQSVTADPHIFSQLTYGNTNRAGDDQQQKEQAEVDKLIHQSEPVRNFKLIVGELIDIGASDVHIEIRNDIAHVKARLHGVMRHFKSYPQAMVLDALGAAFTVLAEELSRTDAAFNMRLAQAAMIPLQHKNLSYSLRYQSHPTVGGLDAVFRILHLTHRTSRSRTLKALGYMPDQIEQLSLALASAWGGLFIAGITGSGKTTTLNTMLDMMVRSGGRKIISIEDPVEYVVNGVSHLSIQRSHSDTEQNNPFMSAMRAFLRLDPDVGMFGEIRDRLSGEIAQTAIETGHKILTTVHATSALGIVSRLSSRMIGIDRSVICSLEFISALVYQVLLPRNCPACRQPAKEVMGVADLSAFEDVFNLDPETFFCASDSGCSQCRIPGMEDVPTKGARQGVAGLLVAAELVLPDVQMLDLLNKQQDFEARRYHLSQRQTTFDHPSMIGKASWGHALYNVSQGAIDPYYFINTFGYPKGFEDILRAAR